MRGTDRSIPVLRNMQAIFDHGRLGGTGISPSCPVDQGIEHSAGASFAPNPDVLRSREHRRAGDRGRLQRRRLDASACSARWRASTRTRSRSSLKLNHNELLTYPNKFDQIMFAHVEAGLATWAAAAVGRDDLLRLGRVGRADHGGQPQAFHDAHELGMATVLWCYLRNPAFKKDGVDYHVAADLTEPGQPPRRDDRGRHHQAEAAREQRRLQRRSNFGKTEQAASTRSSTTDHPIDLTRYQVVELLHGPHRA